MNLTNTTIIHYTTSKYTSSTGNAAAATQSLSSFKDTLTESVVDTFKRRHPDHASHVDQQVRAGRAVRDKNGVPTEDMTMEEYRAYFYALLETIPYDSTRVNDTTILTISDKGWEQMRKDPDYEAWILGYFVEDRAVRNPFFGWGNNAGSMITEHFGASIEEHHGEGFSKAALKGNSDKDDDEEEEDWWIKRHKRMKKLIREQVERNMKKDAAVKAAAKEEYARQQYISSQRQHSFLTTGSTDMPGSKAVPNQEGLAASMAAAAYINTLDLFGLQA